MATNSGVSAAKRRRAGNVNKEFPNINNSEQIKIPANNPVTNSSELTKYSLQDALNLTINKLNMVDNATKQFSGNLNLQGKNQTKLNSDFLEYKKYANELIGKLEERVKSLEEGHVKEHKVTLKTVDEKVNKLQSELDATRNVVLQVQNEVLQKDLSSLNDSN